jgi:hypothetical protein
MFVLSSIVMVVLVAQAGGAAQNPNDVDARRRMVQSLAEKREQPTIQVGLFSYRPDGTLQGAAYDTSLSAETFQYVVGCGIGGGNRPAPDGATDAWRLTGKVMSLTPDEAVIQLDWQRIRAGGAAVSSPGASIQLTLHAGDRVPLDSVNADATAQCPARTIGFEARYGARMFAWIPPAGFTENGGSGGGVGIGVGRGSGRGGGGGGGRTVASAGSGAPGFGRAVHAPKETVAGTDSQQADVDLWLVHSAPGKKEETLHQVLTGVRGSAQFAFAPVTVGAQETRVNLQVSGVLRFTMDDTGARQLVFITMRNAKFSPVGGPARDTLPSTQGASTTTHPMPGPDDVLSFEMPPIRVPNGGPAIPDQFSIRVRIR